MTEFSIGQFDYSRYDSSERNLISFPGELRNSPNKCYQCHIVEIIVYPKEG